LKIAREEADGITVVSSLPGFIDACNAMEFKAEMGAVIACSRRIVLDMGNVKFIDSAGCGVLITSLWLVRGTGGALKLYDVQKQVRSVFELVRMHKIMEIYDNRQDAVLSFSGTDAGPAGHASGEGRLQK
jgi:anti-sigma B factor antagonist